MAQAKKKPRTPAKRPRRNRASQVSRQALERVGQRSLGRLIRAALPWARSGKRRKAPQVTWILVGAAAMTRLNARYRGKRGPTDILSFPVPSQHQAQGFLGELVVCEPVLRRQARELGHSPEVELKILLCHGLLHLFGFDHEKSARERHKMARAEGRLLQTAWPALFGRGHRSRLKGLIRRS